MWTYLEGCMQQRSRGATKAAVLKRLPEITQWRAEGIAQREIARRLGIADSSLRDALKGLGGDPTGVDRGIPTAPPSPLTPVYEGIPASSPEAVKVILEEAQSLLPTLREMVQSWGVLQAMMVEYSQQQHLLHVAPEYQPYDGFYSVRVSHRLIQDIKVYAVDHRLSQSELVTIALQAYMRQP
jgi:hypothetical protein